MRKNVVVLLGKSASGKDTLAKYLAENYKYDYVVKYTTRPQRPNERDGVDYHFVNDEFFTVKKYSGLFLADSEFRGWNYAIGKYDVLDKRFPIVVADNKLIDQIDKSDEIKPIYIYLHRNKQKRIEEQLKRGTDRNEIDRRMQDEDVVWEEVRFKYKPWEVDNNSSVEVTATNILTEIANALGV